jgi:hypothetical protein
VAKEQVERQPPTFTRARQNMVVVAALLDALSAPSTNEVGEVYERLKSILGTATVQQVESSLLHQADASIPPPPTPKTGDGRLPKELRKASRHATTRSG